MHNGYDIRGILRFAPAFFERVWGGHALREKLGLDAPARASIGEAWLLSDHPVHESVVVDGPHEGRTLHTLMEHNGAALMGSLPRPTQAGRFPLMLKLLDCREVLSVQVHPDDALSKQLGESDGGKTEMWYFLHTEAGAKIICGCKPEAGPAAMETAAREGGMAELLQQWEVKPGDAALVRAGTVHALAAGLLAAEIQQTSDVTYRLYDWDRVDAQGKPRELHLERGMRCVNWARAFPGLANPLPRKMEHDRRAVLGACEYFAAERVEVDGAAHAWETGGRSFRVLLGLEGEIGIMSGGDEEPLLPGQALLVAGAEPGYISEGEGAYLDYYVPDLERDVMGPLLEAGHQEQAVRALLAMGDR